MYDRIIKYLNLLNCVRNSMWVRKTKRRYTNINNIILNEITNPN